MKTLALKDISTANLLAILASTHWGPTGLHEAVMRLKLNGIKIRIPYSSDGHKNTLLYRSIQYTSSTRTVFKISLPRLHPKTDWLVDSVLLQTKEEPIDAMWEAELQNIIKLLID